MHLPQRMQGLSSRISSSIATNPDVPLVTGVFKSKIAGAVMGPPANTEVLPCHLARVSNSSTGVPKRTRQLPGLCTRGPVTDTTLSTRGIPVRKARPRAPAVATLFTTTPTAEGRTSSGTSRPRAALIKSRSSP